MKNVEQEVKSWIEKKIIYIAFIAIFLLGIAVRIMLRKFVSRDAQIFLLPWYEEIKSNGGISSLGKQVGNYNLLYQFFIAIFTYLPVNPLYLYKIFSIIFDIALAIMGGIWAKNIWKKNSLECFLIFGCIFMFPVVILNSSFWAQCDSIYCFFCIVTLYLLFQKKYWLAMFFWGAAFSFKLQAVFILPMIMLMYIKNKDFPLKKFVGSIVSIVCLALPGILNGRNILDILKIYFGQVSGDADSIFYNYPGICNIFINADSVSDNRMYIKSLCLILAFCVLGMFCVWVIYQKIEFTSYTFTFTAFILTYTAVIFLPGMHERYGYVYEILAILLMIYDKRTMFLSIALQLCTVITYSSYLFQKGYNVTIMSIINFAIYLIYVWYYIIKLKKESITSEN